MKIRCPVRWTSFAQCLSFVEQDVSHKMSGQGEIDVQSISLHRTSAC